MMQQARSIATLLFCIYAWFPFLGAAQATTDSPQSSQSQGLDPPPVLVAFLHEFGNNTNPHPSVQVTANAVTNDGTPLATIMYRVSGETRVWTQTPSHGPSISITRDGTSSEILQGTRRRKVDPSGSFTVDMYDPIASLVLMAKDGSVNANDVPPSIKSTSPVSVVLKRRHATSRRKAYWWISSTSLLPERVVIDKVDLESHRQYQSDIRFADYKLFDGHLYPTSIQLFSTDGLLETIHITEVAADSGT